jgi:molybdopterin converting factor small subunit
MRVKIHYLGLVKTYTNKTEEDVILNEGAPLSNLLEQLAIEFGKPMFMVLVNGIVIGQLAGVGTKLRNGDMIMLMPLMTGG